MKNTFNRQYVHHKHIKRPLTDLEVESYTVVTLPPADADGSHEINDVHIVSNALYSSLGNIRGSKVA